MAACDQCAVLKLKIAQALLGRADIQGVRTRSGHPAAFCRDVRPDFSRAGHHHQKESNSVVTQARVFCARSRARQIRSIESITDIYLIRHLLHRKNEGLG